MPDMAIPDWAQEQASPPAASQPIAQGGADASYVGNVDPDSGDISVGSGAVQPTSSKGFGFDIPPVNKMVMAKLAAEDSKQRSSYMSNRPIAHNVLDYLDQLEPNLDKFPTGGGQYFGWTKDLYNDAAQLVNPNGQTAKSGGNIDKDTYGLASELGKFEYMPGMRGSVLGLQTILNSKPGLHQPPEVNRNIVADIRGRVTDYMLSQELAQKYRQLSPNQITDQNTYTLDDALKSVYPLTSTDPNTGAVTFHKENVPLLRQAMDDALANPQKYLKAAQDGKQIFGTPMQPQGGSSGDSGSIATQTSQKSNGVPDYSHLWDGR